MPNYVHLNNHTINNISGQHIYDNGYNVFNQENYIGARCNVFIIVIIIYNSVNYLRIF